MLGDFISVPGEDNTRVQPSSCALVASNVLGGGGRWGLAESSPVHATASTAEGTALRKRDLDKNLGIGMGIPRRHHKKTAAAMAETHMVVALKAAPTAWPARLTDMGNDMNGSPGEPLPATHRTPQSKSPPFPTLGAQPPSASGSEIHASQQPLQIPDTKPSGNRRRGAEARNTFTVCHI